MSFVAIRIAKNLCMFLNTIAIVVQLKSEELAKWILPFEVILVLYFVVIIYFIINTGELQVYLKTIFLNLLIFIQLFFV